MYDYEVYGAEISAGKTILIDLVIGLGFFIPIFIFCS